MKRYFAIVSLVLNVACLVDYMAIDSQGRVQDEIHVRVSANETTLCEPLCGQSLGDAATA